MTPTLTAALKHLRQDLANRLEPLAQRQLCRSLGHRWRERLLDPVTTTHLFLLQILHGNTACSHLPRLTGQPFTASAYCQARSRLPLAVLQSLLLQVVQTLQPLADAVGTWRGHRTWLVDGTGVSLPDTPALQQAFGQPTNQAEGCGFPVARVLALFHAGTGLLQSFLVSPLRSHEMASVTRLHPQLRPGDVLVGDRAFGTFAHLALLAGRGLHGVFDGIPIARRDRHRVNRRPQALTAHHVQRRPAHRRLIDHERAVGQRRRREQVAQARADVGEGRPRREPFEVTYGVAL